MRKETFQDVTWLFQDFGRHLKALVSGAPTGADTRELLRILVLSREHQFVGGRNPFNWLKELQNVLNVWHHLDSEGSLPDDDVWRDLDTLERVAIYLKIDPDFVANVKSGKHEVPTARQSDMIRE